MSIKKFIYFWLGGLVCCFLVMALAMVFSTNELRAMNNAILRDAGAVEMTHRQENALLEERRIDLLLRDTGNSVYEQREKVLMAKSRALVEELATDDLPAKDRARVHTIRGFFEAYRAAALASPPLPLPAVSQAADRLLNAVEDYREETRTRMTATLARSKRLDTLVDRWSLGVFLFVSLAAGLGSALLLRRVVRPAHALSRTAARFGRGDTQARATVYFNDELGLLCRSFNRMADNIAFLQSERRHLLAALAHDLKNPLVLIGGAARRLKRKEAVGPAHLPLLESIIGQSDAMEELIGELMETVRREDADRALEKAEVDLHELLTALHAKQVGAIASHPIHYQGTPCPVRGDARRLARVAANLVSNAVKYSPAGRPIDLRLTRQGDWAVFTVTDAGVGIPAEEITGLGEPFRRLKHTSAMAKGSGMGLFSARRIVNGHGGSLAIDSRLGAGTTVTVKVPLATAAAPCQPARPESDKQAVPLAARPDDAEARR